MIDFTLSDEHELLERSIREWGAREVAPYIRENDRKHHFDRERILGGMAKLGLLGISVPQEYGGAGMDYIALGIASEELEYLDTSLRVIMSVHAGLNCLSLLSWGTEDQKQRYLVPQAQGKKIAGYGLTEPGAGSDARAIQTTATKKGDRYVLNGEKSWISLADVADHFLVIAWTDLEKKKKGDPSGMTAFIVERTAKGFTSGPMKEKWGILAGNTGWFKMDDVEVPEENILGKAGEGFKIAMFSLDQGRYTVAAGATGTDPGVPRCQREVCKGAQDIRRGDRTAPAREGNDRGHGVGLPVGAPAVAAVRMDEEPRPAQHEGDRAREMVRDRCLREGRRRRGPDSRRERLFRRVSGRAFFQELQRRGHLRRHARDPQTHASRLSARLSHRPSDPLRASCCTQEVRSENF